MIILAPNNDGGWNQNWSTKTNTVRLLTNEEDPSQQSEADFVGSNYDFALLPGFPGEEIVETVRQVHKVRVQLQGTDPLSLAEVQVFDYSNENRALNKPATQSSSHVHYPASLAVNGNLDDFSHTLNQTRKYNFSCKYTIFCSAFLQALSPLPFTSVKVLGGKLICKRMCK